MHYSGILITTDPSHVGDCVNRLHRIRGVEVFQQDPDKGRVVVVQETDSVESQEDGFNQMSTLRHVQSIELVYHYHDPDSSGAEAKP